jgi:hypothetical protein
MAITDLSLSQTQPQEIPKKEDHESAENVSAVAPKRRGRPPKRASVVAPIEDSSSKRFKLKGSGRRDVSLPPIESKNTPQQTATHGPPDTPEEPSTSTSVVPAKRGRGRPRKTASARLPTPPKLEPKSEARTGNEGPSARTRASTGAVSESLPPTFNSQAAASQPAIQANASQPSVVPTVSATNPQAHRPATRSSSSDGAAPSSDESEPSRRLPPVPAGVIDGGNIPQPYRHRWGYYVDEEGLPIPGPA